MKSTTARAKLQLSGLSQLSWRAYTVDCVQDAGQNSTQLSRSAYRTFQPKHRA